MMVMKHNLQMTELPRRVTVAHPDYELLCGMAFRITLDGVEQREVVAYDMDAGTLERFQRDAEGKLVVRDDSLILEEVRGVVEVELPSAS